MNEDLLRAMVREAVARHMGAAGRPQAPIEQPLPILQHPSHFRYSLPEGGGPCMIEPHVGCTHCGFCQSHGH